MSTPILVYTCDAYADVVPGFAYLLGVFWSQLQPVYIAGTKSFPLPPNFTWLEVESRVAERWSDGLIEALRQMNEPVFIWMLEDYYLCRQVDNAAIESLAEYMMMHPDVLKIDLTGDRLHSGAADDVDYWGHVDLLRTPWETPYQYSTQCALWNREHLLSILRPEMSPWDFELQDKKPEHLHVLGTRQWPVRYVNFIGMGLEKDEYRTEHIRHGLGGTTIERIPDDHVAFMHDHNLFPKDRKLNNSVNN
jgi:hypothetical protein